MRVFVLEPLTSARTFMFLVGPATPLSVALELCAGCVLVSNEAAPAAKKAYLVLGTVHGEEVACASRENRHENGQDGEQQSSVGERGRARRGEGAFWVAERCERAQAYEGQGRKAGKERHALRRGWSVSGAGDWWVKYRASDVLPYCSEFLLGKVDQWQEKSARDARK